MKLEKYQIEEHNNKLVQQHKRKFEFIAQDVQDVEGIIQKLIKFQIAIPSWALGTGGTRSSHSMGYSGKSITNTSFGCAVRSSF